MREFIIGRNETGQRFDKYLFKLLGGAGAGLIYKQLRCKNITLNKVRAKGSEILNENDKIQIFMADSTIDKFMGKPASEALPEIRDDLNVIYEDDNVIIADKPAGVLSQKASPDDISMNELLMAHVLSNGMTDEDLAAFKPAFCNRLDRNTSGIMTGGTSLAGLQKMSELIKEHSLHKYYIAAISGILDKKLHAKGYLLKNSTDNKVTITEEKRDGSVFIDTYYTPIIIKRDENMTLVKAELITGKSHQIRAQLAFLGYPIIGDEKYGRKDINRKYGIHSQLLHAYMLKFPELDGEFEMLSERSFFTVFPASFKRFFDADDVREAFNG